MLLARGVRLSDPDWEGQTVLTHRVGLFRMRQAEPSLGAQPSVLMDDASITSQRHR